MGTARDHTQRIRWITVCTGLLIAITAASAQTAAPDGTQTTLRADSSSPRFPSALLRFERNVNTFVWDMRGGYSYQNDGWTANIDERFIRTLIRSDRENVRDDQTARLGLRRRLSSAFSAVVTANSFVFSDDRSLGLSNLENNTLLAGIAWTPIPALTVQPLAGWCFDTQQGVRDNGAAYSADANLSPLSLGSTSLTASALILGEQLAPRAVAERRVTAGIHSLLGEDGVNRVQAGWRESVRDFYLSYDSAVFSLYGVTHPVESRTERVFNVTDQLDLALAENLRMLATIDASQRGVLRAQKQRDVNSVTPVFDTHLDEFRLTMGGQLRYESVNGVRADVRAEFGERSETYTADRFDGANDIAYVRQQRLEEGKNNSILQTRLASSLLLPIGSADTLSAVFSTVKLAYDTPSSSNYDDRDELFLLGSLRWSRRMDPFLTCFLMSDVSLRHTVYIFAQRSANNTWNRVLRLSPGAELRLPGRFITRLQTEVTANYTVYDFENLNPSLESYSLRQLSVADSTLLHVSGSVWIDARVLLRMYERGHIYWSSFTLRPLQYFNERTIAVALTHETETVSAAVGIRIFTQTRYSYQNAVKREDGTLSSYGPTCSLRLRTGLAELRAEGWYQVTAQSGGGTITTPNVSMGVHWNM